MSIILKGIDKPSDCDYCDIEDHGYCRALGSYIDVEEGIDTRCPIEDLVRCAECKHNVGLRDGTEFWEEDITCDYWESDGLTADDFCSYGEREGE